MSGVEKFMGMNNTDIENDTEDQIYEDQEPTKMSYNKTEQDLENSNRKVRY